MVNSKYIAICQYTPDNPPEYLNIYGRVICSSPGILDLKPGDTHMLCFIDVSGNEMECMQMMGEVW